MKTRLFWAVAGAVGLIAGAAAAGQLDFNYVLNGGAQYESWSQSSNPVPAGYVPVGPPPDDFTQILVTDGVDNYGDTFFTVNYSGPAVSGGGFAAGALSAYGTLVFSGTLAAPVFSPGVYVFDAGVLTISAPEPATWATLTLGLFLLGAATRRRRPASA